MTQVHLFCNSWHQSQSVGSAVENFQVKKFQWKSSEGGQNDRFWSKLILNLLRLDASLALQEPISSRKYQTIGKMFDIWTIAGFLSNSLAIDGFGQKWTVWWSISVVMILCLWFISNDLTSLFPSSRQLNSSSSKSKT